ncbi:MAG TPA: DUF4931 domain-containing protein [Candidatus Saccharimonadales bacterium]|nr:DUF4931 domain-containing protein [Candidatus Saccharimonadales bacterium]
MKAPITPKSEIRRHYFMNQYVVIAPKRNLRPDSFASASNGHKLETPTSPMIERDPAIAEIKGEGGKWAVKVIPNAFPALTLDNPAAYGQQEIIVETPEHNLEFSELSHDQILRVFKAYGDRIKKLSQLPRIRYVSVFKNDGPEAGASIAHAHSQVMALPLIPPALEVEAEAADQYFDQFASCAYCDLLNWEVKQSVRVIYEDKSVCAVAPYASRFPFEAWILPKRHIGNFTDLSAAELSSIAIILKNLTLKLDSIKISYNFFLQNSLSNHDHHFVLKLEPRPNVWAGLELSTEVILNPVNPEYATLWYKGKIK